MSIKQKFEDVLDAVVESEAFNAVMEKVDDIEYALTTPEGQKKAEKIAEAAVNSAVASAVLFRANRAMRRGETGRAIFLAILWVGYTNNIASTRAANAASERQKHLCAHLSHLSRQQQDATLASSGLSLN